MAKVLHTKWYVETVKALQINGLWHPSRIDFYLPVKGVVQGL